MPVRNERILKAENAGKIETEVHNGYEEKLCKTGLENRFYKAITNVTRTILLRFREKKERCRIIEEQDNGR